MGMIWAGFKRLWNRDNLPASIVVKASKTERQSEFDPLAAVGAEQMQLFARRYRADALADGWRDRSGNPHDHVGGRQFARIGGHNLRPILAAAVNESLRADALDRLHGQVERDAAGGGFARNLEILGSDSEQARFAVAIELRPDFVGPQRQQIHRRRADEGRDKGGRGLLIDIERVADLLDLAAVHDN